MHTWCALRVEGDGQGCPCDAFARAFHALWKEIKVLIIESSTETTFSPKTIEAPPRAHFGTATRIKGIVPLTAGRLSAACVIRFSSIKTDVVPGIASHPEQRVLSLARVPGGLTPLWTLPAELAVDQAGVLPVVAVQGALVLLVYSAEFVLKPAIWRLT
ncbi:MAG: hypothetical protein MUQ10_12595 [Anaerolineae bacterium]|nr:hypothetical protein [Anaerolineae bacterium]